MGPVVKTHVEDRVGRIRLDDPANGNRLGTPQLRALAEGLEEMARLRPAVVAIEASGEDFCLGRDPGGDDDPAAARESLALVLELGDRIRALPSLVLVAARGRARGLGAGIVLHADLAIAAEGASLAFDEVERGFPPTLVMTYVERYLPRKVAREMLATGRPLSAAEALRHGVVNQVVADAELDSAVADLVGELSARDPAALGACKPTLVEIEALPPERRADHGLQAGVDFFTRAHAGRETESNDTREKES